MDDNIVENEDELAGLIEAVATQYRKQINDPSLSKSEVRVDIVRKLKLISDAIKGLMRARQMPIDAFQQDIPPKNSESRSQAHEAKG
jgi:hypothetical protein